MQFKWIGAGFVILLICTFAEVGFAEPTLQPRYSPDQAVALLESGDAREQAWGAWLAGRFFLTDSIPLLDRAVEIRLNSSEDPDAALDIALDALIELQASVSPLLLERIFQRRPEQALVMLSRAGADANWLLRSILDKTSGEQWFAAANLLQHRNAPGFAALVLKDVILEAHVGGFGSGGAAGACACGAVSLMPGYPPSATYRLAMSAAPGRVVLAPGPKTVYYERRVAPAGLTPNHGWCSISGPAPADRLAYFAHVAPSIRAVKYCENTAPGAIDAAINTCVSGLRSEYRSFLNRLAEYNLLTAEEASALSRVRIRVQRLQ